MKVAFARSAASKWVLEHASGISNFMGAYFSGSTVGMSDDFILSPASDIDVVIVFANAAPALKLGKFMYQGTLIEVTYISWSQLSSVEAVLSSYHLAGSFRINTIIMDPTGQLSGLQTQVSRHFYELEWVRRRCENARERIENGLSLIDISSPLHDQVTSWLFPTGVTTHVLLVAALRNPTVRLRYFAVHDVLVEYGFTSIYEDLLTLLGCSQLSPKLVEHHLAELVRTFDAAASVAKTPFFFSSDITASARPIAIDGSLALIGAGFHREAVFWIVATFARCLKILAVDASTEQYADHAPAFKALISDLGISASDDLLNRAEAVIQFLPLLMETSEAIMKANSEIMVS